MVTSLFRGNLSFGMLILSGVRTLDAFCGELDSSRWSLSSPLSSPDECSSSSCSSFLLSEPSGRSGAPAFLALRARSCSFFFLPLNGFFRCMIFATSQEVSELLLLSSGCFFTISLAMRVFAYSFCLHLTLSPFSFQWCIVFFVFLFFYICYKYLQCKVAIHYLRLHTEFTTYILIT